MQPKSLYLGLSSEQKAILDGSGRLKIVKAVPGAGKTRLFVAAFEQYRDRLGRPGSGVAALSFTNVARDEISQRLGGWRSPDFVGTIDSFLLHFVIRPFGHLVGINSDGAQLIPAPLASHFEQTVVVGHKTSDRARLMEVEFVGTDPQERVRMRARTPYKAVDVPPSATKPILREKRTLWKTLGYLSHSDSHLLAARILREPTHHNAVINCISRKFPFVLVDELQDTQFFLGEALKSILGCARVEGLVVGDPEQAIYEFGGAHPSLFEDLEKLPGAVPYDLAKTHRCCKEVCRTMRAVSCRPADIEPADGIAGGRCILLVVGDREREIVSNLLRLVKSTHQTGEKVAVLSRQTGTAVMIRGAARRAKFPGQSSIANHTHQAVLRLLEGDPGNARRIIEADLANLALHRNVATRRLLADAGIPLPKWRRTVGSLLLQAADSAHRESWSEWQARVKGLFGAALSDLGFAETAMALGTKFRNAPREALSMPRELDISPVISVDWPPGTEIRNIHEVK
jgi:DNA helicase-2/ATP-dependent DNA helicase PcrA